MITHRYVNITFDERTNKYGVIHMYWDDGADNPCMNNWENVDIDGLSRIVIDWRNKHDSLTEEEKDRKVWEWWLELKAGHSIHMEGM